MYALVGDDKKLQLLCKRKIAMAYFSVLSMYVRYGTDFSSERIEELLDEYKKIKHFHLRTEKSLIIHIISFFSLHEHSCMQESLSKNQRGLLLLLIGLYAMRRFVMNAPLKIAYILPSLDSKAPVFLVKRLSDYFTREGHEVTVFYFDPIENVSFNCGIHQIKMNEPIAFDQFDIVHSHMMRPDEYVSKYAGMIKHAKTVSTIHCNIKDDLYYSYGKLISFVYTKKWLSWLKSFDVTVQINDYLLNLYSKKLNHNYLVYNGISTSANKDDYLEIICNIKAFKDKNLTVLCSYSGIERRKGLKQIFKLLKNRNDLAYICIGDGKQKKELVKFAKDNGIAERVYFSAFKQNPYHVLECADIFVIPSYSEGFSLALLEAGITGASVVCSDIPAFTIPFSNDEISSFVLDNIESLSKAVDEAIALKTKKSLALKKKIHESFSEELMFQKYADLYLALRKGGIQQNTLCSQ